MKLATWKKRLVLWMGLLLLSVPGFARERLSGNCEEGGKTVSTHSAVPTTIGRPGSPGCTVTVYLTGTMKPAAIFLDNSGTVHPNPFTAAPADGAWFFYADEGTYDVRFSSTQGDKGAAGTLNAADFGVLCDGTTDDTAALSRAVQTASKLQTKLIIQAGTCIVSPSKNQILPIASNVWIQGSGYTTVLKVKDGTGVYNAFFGPYGAANISNFMLTDLTIDQNSLKALPYSPANFRMVVGTGPGGGFLTIERVHVTNVEGINTFYSATPYTTVRDCILDLIGGSGVAHDYSALYIAAEHSVIANNIFTARTVGSAVTAIETHGGKHTITGNVIDGLATGMNITGVAATESSGIKVSGNSSISNANFGIFLYSFVYGSHTTGYGINGGIITGNSIRITQNAAAYAGFNNNTGGIILYPNANLSVLPYKDILISNNIIEFDSQSKVNNTAGFGIGYWDSAGGNTVTDLRIVNNTIINCPMAGIRFSAEGSDIEVSGNQIVNPGSSLGVLVNSFRAGIFFASKLPIHNLRVLNNNITDNQPVTQMSYGIEFLTGNVGDIIARGNTTSVTGDGRKFVFATGAINNTQLPLINDTVYAPHNLLALPSFSSQLGSTMINAATGVTYSVAAGLTTLESHRERNCSSHRGQLVRRRFYVERSPDGSIADRGQHCCVGMGLHGVGHARCVGPDKRHGFPESCCWNLWRNRFSQRCGEGGAWECLFE